MIDEGINIGQDSVLQELSEQLKATEERLIGRLVSLDNRMDAIETRMDT